MKRGFIALLLLTLLYSLCIHEALSQEYPPPLVPPEFKYGSVSIGGELHGAAHGDEVSFKVEELLIIFYNDLASQTDIGLIVDELDLGDTEPSLRGAFETSQYCIDNEIVLPPSASVNIISAGNEWVVAGKFHVIRADIDVWNGVDDWIDGSMLAVSMYNGTIASYEVGSIGEAGDLYFTQIPMNSDQVLWGDDDPHILREPGHALPIPPWNRANAYINGVRVNEINGDPVSTSSGTYVLTLGLKPFEELNLNAPECVEIEIPLVAGQNLFSTPVTPPDTDTEAVLGPIKDDIDSLYAYRDGQWLLYVPDVLDQVKNIVPGEGYLIYMKNPRDLPTGCGQLPLDTGIQLDIGQNLVGLNSLEQVTTGEAFSDIKDCLDSVYVYRGGQWLLYVPDVLDQINVINPGEAPLIYAKGVCVWDVGQ